MIETKHINTWMDGCKYVCIDGCIDGWVDGWMLKSALSLGDNKELSAADSVGLHDVRKSQVIVTVPLTLHLVHVNLSD